MISLAVGIFLLYCLIIALIYGVQKTLSRFSEISQKTEVMATNKGIAIKANKTNYGKNRDFAIIP